MPLTKPVPMLQPFAASGSRNAIPNEASATPGRASYQTGFPSLTMTRIEDGGVPPSGRDFNGVLNEISAHTAYVNGGGRYKFDASLASYVGGYSKGFVLQSDDGLSEYISMVANNADNFNNGTGIGTTWRAYAGAAVDGGLYTIINTTGGTINITEAQASNQNIVVQGVLTSAVNLILPNTRPNFSWRITNGTSGTFSMTVRANGSANTLPLTQGRTNTVYIRPNGNDLIFPDYDSGLDNPAFRGVPTAPTPPALTNSNQIATTEYVDVAVANNSLNVAFRYVNAAITAGPTGDLWVDTRTGAFAITLPAAPIGANTLQFRDITGTWGDNPLTINRNGKTIEGVAENLVCNVAGEVIGMWFDAANNNWRII